MSRQLLSLKDIRLSFGGTPLLQGANLQLNDGDRMCLVGRNGSGKSTLLKIIAGLVEEDGGDRFVQPTTTVRYLQQDPDLSGFTTVLEYVESGLGPIDDRHLCRYYLNELGLTGEELTATLSGGERRRAALACALAPMPDILLLDEPTNHLDILAIEWLEQELMNSNSSFILISHDRRFLERLTNCTVWLDRGFTKRMSRGFAHFETWRDEVLTEEETQQEKLDQRIATEEHWMRYGVTARRKRNMRRVALLSTLRKQRRDYMGAQGSVKLKMSATEMSGRLVAECERISKSYDDRTLVKDLSIVLLRGDRIAIVGPNGAGKTTLLKMLSSQLEPDSGHVKQGTNLEVTWIEQDRHTLSPETTVQDAITGGRGNSVDINGETKHVVAYMQDFLFRPEQARTPVSVLSGGEKARLLLAREFAKPSNLLILDEPTNDLDLDTLDLLQEILMDYKGTLLFVSHDRDFIDRLATSVLMCEGDGKWVEYAGGYTDMVAQRGAGIERNKPVAEKTVQKQRTAPSLAAQMRKLTFKDQHALETLPDLINNLTIEIAKLENRLMDTTLFAKDPKEFERLSSGLHKAQTQKTQSEDRWLELEIIREELAVVS